MRNLRYRTDLKQAELAKKVGVKQDLVSRWERGLIEPSKKEVRPADTFNTTAKNFIHGDKKNRR